MQIEKTKRHTGEGVAMKWFFVVLISFCLFISCMTSEGALFESVIGAEEEETPKDTTPEKATGKPTSSYKGAETEEVDEQEEEFVETEVEEVGIKVVVQPDDAQVYFNNEFVGTGTVLVTPKAGSYQITVRREGYYPQTVWAQYDDNTLVVIGVSLNEITGYLFLEVEPPNATATINGRPVSEGVSELQIGTYSLRVRKFGYEDWFESVRIFEKSTTKIAVSLKEADFEITSLEVSRKVFNPANPGKLGTTKLTFEVTSWGNGTFIVSDAADREVYTHPIPRFTTWDQSIEWDGRDANGGKLPDGEYTLTVSAKGEKEPETLSRSLGVRIDSSAVISFRSVMSGTSGTIFCPLPATLPQGSFQINSGIIGHYSTKLGVGRYPTFASIRAGLGGNVEVDMQGALFIGPEEPIPFSGGVGFKFRLPDMDFFALGATGKLTYVGNTSVDTFHNYTGMSIGMIAALKTTPLVLTLSPDIVVSPFSVIYPKSTQSAAFNAWGYGRIGILADFGTITTGISGSVRTIPFAQGFDLQPPYSAGAELHWLIPGTQLILSGYLTGEYAAVNNYYFMGGAGVGFIN